MFIDWLTLYQDHSEKLPFISDTLDLLVDTDTGQIITERQPSLKIDGSYSTSINIRISDRRITVKGNPSRFNRLDNLFGFKTLDECILVYNQILSGLGLPSFTKCTEIFHLTGDDGKRALSKSNGATITEIHITTNKAVGSGSVFQYIKALSTQRYRNSIPRLHPNGCTLDWLSKLNNAPLIYADVYNKANEITLHTLPKIKRAFGVESSEYKYIQQLIEYCNSQGVCRFEQKLKSRYLRRENLQYYGLSNFSKLHKIHNDFLDIDKKLQVDKMDYLTISQALLKNEICASTLSANTSANYAFRWMHGETFDFAKSQVKTHRARLRQIGIDIAEPCDLSRFTPVITHEQKPIHVTALTVPHWYKPAKINHLQLVA